MIKLMIRILNFSGKYKGRILFALLFSFLKAVLMKSPIALAIIALTAFYEGTATSTMCLQIGIAIGVSLVLQIIFQHLDNILQSSAGYMVMAEKRMQLGAHLRKLPMGYFTEGNIGKISSVLSTDMSFVEENCMMILADMIGYIFAEIILIVFLMFFNVWLGLAAFASVVVIWLIGTAMNNQAIKDSHIRQEQNENLTEAVLDFTEGIGIIKTYNILGDKSKELSDNFRKTCEESFVFEKHVARGMLFLNFVFGLGVALVIALAMLLHFSASLGAIMTVGIMLFVFDLFGPVKALYGNSVRLTIMNSCLDRLEEVINEPELPDDGKDTIPAAGNAPEVAFKNVSFGYGKKEILHDISFDLKQNNMLALVGPSGGGKSTIANLLPRFWDIQKGQVLIRGKDIRNVKLADLMNHISMVFQRVYLFQDTIYNNISMGRPDATEAEVTDAARKARCYDFIMALPDGFSTVVGEGGATLSGGEKQRISIARCILKDAPIIILDEATASVDADNEIYIQEAISELCKGKTLLVIAHRLNTIRNANEILVISDGEISEQGTHAELIGKNGIYKKFVTARENSKGWSRRTSG